MSMYLYIYIYIYVYVWDQLSETSLYISCTEMKPGPWKPGPLVITLNQGGSNIKPKRNQEQTPRPWNPVPLENE